YLSMRTPACHSPPPVARFYYLLDVARRGRAEWAPVDSQPCLDFLQQRGAVGRGLQLALVGGLDPALEGQRTPVARGPRIPQIQRLHVGVAGAGDAADAAHADGDPGHAGLVDGLPRPYARADGAGL